MARDCAARLWPDIRRLRPGAGSLVAATDSPGGVHEVAGIGGKGLKIGRGGCWRNGRAPALRRDIALLPEIRDELRMDWSTPESRRRRANGYHQPCAAAS